MKSFTICASCRFARPAPNRDLKARECWAVPPSPVVLPHPQGCEVRMVRPLVSQDDTCGFWAPPGDVSPIHSLPQKPEREAGNA